MKSMRPVCKEKLTFALFLYVIRYIIVTVCKVCGLPPPPHPFCTYKWYEIYADCMRDYGLAYSNIMHISVYIRARMRTRQCLHTQDSPKLYLL